MMLRQAVAIALLAGTAGCGPAALPDPRILSITPAEVVASEAALVVIDIEAVPPFWVDYGAQQARVFPRLEITIGDRAFGEAKVPTGGRLEVTVPSVYAPGTYDVTLKLLDGRQTTAPGGFTVKPGLWPDHYVISPIATQKANAPFAVTIRAVGANASSFRGNVLLRLEPGFLSPPISGQFSAGVLVQQVFLFGVPGQKVTLTVADSAGNTGVSNPFDVVE